MIGCLQRYLTVVLQEGFKNAAESIVIPCQIPARGSVRGARRER